MDTTESLQQLGFTAYEARAYAALIDEDGLNGYELAKKTGIPRANIYSVAEKLVGRGAILRSEQAGSQRYSAVPPKQLLHSLESEYKRALSTAKKAMERQTKKASSNAVFNLRGKELIARAKQIIDNCQHTLFIGIEQKEAGALAQAMEHAAQRGIAITTLCMQACAQECGGCQGNIERYNIAPVGENDWLIIIADDQTALVGQISSHNAEGMVTDQRIGVEIANAFIRQNMTLAAMGQSLGSRLNDVLPSNVIQQLNNLYPENGFSTYINNLISTAS